MARPVVVGHLGVGHAARQLVEDGATATVGVLVQTDHGAGIDAGRPEQLVAVLAWRRHRVLVRQDPRIRTVRLEPDPGEEAALCPRDVRAGNAIGLLVDVDRRVRILVERPVRAPRRQGPGRPPVAVVGCVTGLLGRQVEAHDVGRVPGHQPLTLGGVDDVVWRGDDERQVGDGRRVVAERTERADVGHGTSRGRQAARRLSGPSHRTIAAAPTPRTEPGGRAAAGLRRRW